MKKWFVLLIFAAFLTSCRSAKPAFTVSNGQQLALQHKRVAIIPFAVTFSESYKKIMPQTGTSWQEQERIAGIDLQKTAFSYFAKRANKKNFELIIPDYNTINKTLAELEIPYSQLIVSDKSRIASLLGVDAVIFGHSYVEFDINRGYMGTNGIKTVLDLYDGFSGQKIWTADEKEYLRSRFDSPQDLAKRSVGNLVNRLPYAKK